MNRIFTTAVPVLLFVLLSVGVSAQRGRSGGGNAGAPADTPILLTAYDSAEYGLKFPAPPGMSLFTPEHPGNFRGALGNGRIVYIVDLMGNAGSVSVRYLPKATEAELSGFRNMMDTNPPQAKLSDYKKISLGSIKVGAARDKDAVEYVYEAKDTDTLTRTRQVVFLHNGNGFIFTCTAPAKDYAAVDSKSFQRLFATIEFK